MESAVLNLYREPLNIYEVNLGSWMRVPEENNRFLTYKELADKLVKYVKKIRRVSEGKSTRSYKYERHKCCAGCDIYLDANIWV